MKKQFVVFKLALLLLFAGLQTFGQVLREGNPPSFLIEIPGEEVAAWEYSQGISMQSLMSEDAEDAKAGMPLRGGVTVEVNQDFFQKASLVSVKDGVHIWQYRLKAADAKALGVVFSTFWLPEAGELFVYSPDRSHVLGAIGSENNTEAQTLSTHILPGDELLLEYVEKLASGAKTQALIRIGELIWVYKGASLLYGKDLGDSDPCQVNINCPEGNNWQTQKRGVARILFRVGTSWYWCSGSLVNNTNQDGSPLFLTAEHCGGTASAADRNVWQFYFNYERPGCPNTGTPPSNMLTGCLLRAMGPLSGGSDFQLVSLNQTPPLAWNPYFNGWSRATAASASGVGIHHPSGDAKKISTYTSPLTSAAPNIGGSQMATNSAWRVIWVQTETNHGVTEGGSSGSPLFNPQGLIVGTLSGGSSSCTSPNSPDYYGKFDYHWLSNGSTNATRLQPWLDPAGTNPTTLSGYDPNGSSTFNPPQNLTAQVSNQTNVVLNWQSPSSGQLTYNWYSYTTAYTNLVWATPERAVKFAASDFVFSYPVTITKVAHTFYEHTSYPWPSNQFRFKIYQVSNNNLLYTSPILTAAHLVENEHTLSSPVSVNGDFYVAVAPVDASGHPSSLANAVALNATHSYYGTGGNWTLYQDATSGFELMLKVYLGYSQGKNAMGEEDVKEVLVESGKSLNAISLQPIQTVEVPHGSIAKIGEKSTLSGYKIYRNNQLVHTISNASTLSYTHTNVPAGTHTYHVTATYTSPSGESGPSNTAQVTVGSNCNPITSYPFSESFESANFPPTCWTLESNSSNTWTTSTGYSISGTPPTPVNPQSGSRFAYVSWHATQTQNEWLISPVLNFSGVTNPQLSFWFSGSYYWSVSPNNNCDLKVMVSVNNGSWSQIWTETNHSSFNSENSYVWLNTQLSLASYQGQSNVRLAFVYTGTDGAHFNLDNVVITATPVGIEDTFVDSEVSLSPVPARDFIKLSYPASWNEIHVQVVGLHGQQVFEVAHEGHEGEMKISITDLKAGVYFARIQSGSRIVVRKFVVH